MTDMEKREQARLFYQTWHQRGEEEQECQLYWIDVLQNLLGATDVTARVNFEKKVIVEGHSKKIDAYIPETRVLIEQKSYGIPLDKKIPQSGGIMLTPYEQAKRYNDHLPTDEKARWIVTSNFSELWIYNMNTAVPEQMITKIAIDELQSQYPLLDFLLKKEVTAITRETELSLQAGNLVGKIYDEIAKEYHDLTLKESQNSLNVLCVRLVFCLYAEDAGLFGEKNAFCDYLSHYSPQDLRGALIALFRVLDTPVSERASLYLSEELEAFPYCNGGLFSNQEIEIPKITQEIKDTLLASAHFDWVEISPTIFGAVFESTLNPETRRAGGMHYTSIENIHKVIDPLFLDDLKQELDRILEQKVEKTKRANLEEFQKKLASLHFFDPACGSGNFLTETYLCLRRLENQVISELNHGQIALGTQESTPILVTINQFYGIEINDFAVTVAKTALWIAESQMMKETEDIVHMNLDFLPLKTNANIVEGNALRLDWESVVPKEKLNYIIGNPPFVGARLMSAEQKEDLVSVIGQNQKSVGNLDYVAGWYRKCSDLSKGTCVRSALVSTNSITQGEQVAPLWKTLFADGLHIDFAYRTFRWDSEANDKAHVHCVIVGFSHTENKARKFVIDEKGEKKQVNNINGYLIDAESIVIENRNKPLCDVPEIGIGNQPIDDGNYLFTEEEMMSFLQSEPKAEQYFKPWYGAYEFIRQKPRYCLWLGECSPKELREMPHCMKRIQNVREFRLGSQRVSTRKIADNPTRFQVENMPQSDYLIIPRVSSERRNWVPIGYMSAGVFPSDAVHVIQDTSLYHFGVLTSNVHMAWMRAVCGRLKSDYRYSKDIVYNNFPWCEPTEEQKQKIEQTAQGILDARAKYPDSSLADLYDPLLMPQDLRRAHQENDKAVMKAYGLDIKETSEMDCVSFLMKKYQELTKQ